MTKPVEPTIPTENQRGGVLTRSELVRIQECIRKTGIPLESVKRFVLKASCVEAILNSGARRVLVPAWYG